METDIPCGVYALRLLLDGSPVKNTPLPRSGFGFDWLE